jgi:hypothetical protein
MLAIYNSKNKRFRRDGDEFKREAHKWREAQGNEAYPVPFADIRDGRIRQRISRMTHGLDVLAIFDHGSVKGLPRMRENLGNVKGLAATIASVTDEITIILYSCSCGRGWWGRWGFRWLNKKNKADCEVQADSYSRRDGYAIALCSELASLGVDAVIWAHLTRGHTARNPHVVTAAGHTLCGPVYRARWIKLRTPEWKQWKADMRGPKRFTFWR